MSLELGLLVGLGAADYAAIAGTAIAATAVLTKAIKEVRDYFRGSKTLARNSASVLRHSFNYRTVGNFSDVSTSYFRLKMYEKFQDSIGLHL